MEKFLNTAVLLVVSEVKAEETVTRETFDESGKENGVKTDEQFNAEIKAATGKRVLLIEAQCGGKKAMYQSPQVEENNLSLANAMMTCLIPIAQSVVKQFRTEKVEPKSIITLN
tara:strand:- start:2587 stop:2928 length:342 start_codon:yes stop_codon:yes gene_type:complete